MQLLERKHTTQVQRLNFEWSKLLIIYTGVNGAQRLGAVERDVLSLQLRMQLKRRFSHVSVSDQPNNSGRLLIVRVTEVEAKKWALY